MASSEVAASQAPGAPPERIDISWLILQRLEDIRRDQDRLRAELDALRRDVGQKFTQLTGWFIVGLITVIGTVIGSALAVVFCSAMIGSPLHRDGPDHHLRRT